MEILEKEAGVPRASSGDPELDRFLSGGFPRGSLILISGNPGTGKTTLTSTFLYHGSKNELENGIYVSFSESKRSFFENMLSVGLDFESLEKEGHFRFLEMFSPTKEGMGEIAKFILEETKQFGAKRLAIDSYSVMAQALGNQYEGRQVLHTFFSKIIRNLGCTTMLIVEQPSGEFRIGDTSEEFVADGVINLKLSTPRELEIRKMRGTRLRTTNLLYTLDHGFTVVTTTLRKPGVPKMWQPFPDKDDRLSTGSPDLDAILGGGLPRGAYLILEAGPEVAIADVRLITNSLFCNFVSKRRGVVLLPTRGVDRRELKQNLVPFVGEDAFDDYAEIVDQVPIPSNRRRSLGYDDTDPYADVFDDAVRRLKAATGNQPVARIISYDALESAYARFPDAMVKQVAEGMVRTKADGNLTVGYLRPSLSNKETIVAMANWHIKLSRKDGVLLLQGLLPATNTYAVDCDVSKGYPVMTLKILT